MTGAGLGGPEGGSGKSKGTDDPEYCRIDTRMDQTSLDKTFRRAGVWVGALASGLIGAALARILTGHWGLTSLLAAGFGAACLLAGWVLGGRGPAAGRAPEAGPGAGLEREYDSVLRSVTHDLRSPLGAIINFASLVELEPKQELSDDTRHLLARIRRAAQSALDLLDGLARLTRLAREPLRPVRVDAEALARQAFVELPLPLREVELAIGSLPASIADPALLRACFAELLANAAKFSRGPEKAQVAVGGRRESDGSIVYWVTDQGVGFDPRFGGRLFRVFERLHSRDEFPGAGVGLAIVRLAAERHGGRAWAESELGRGARFYLSLPGSSEVAP
jgi:signal transduction histidine kinase